MSVEYEWRFDEDSPSQEPTEDGTKHRPRWRTILAIAAAVLIIIALGTYLVWRLRRASVADTVADVRAAVQLELRAFEEGDTELYLGLQDDDDGAWIESRQRRLSQGTLLPPPLPGFIATSVLTIETPTVTGDRAEIGCVRLAGPSGGEQYPFRAVSFYRLLPDGRWVHTAPDPDYAGRPLVWVGPRNDLAGHIVETGLFEQLAPELELTAAAFCELLSCPSDLRFSLALTDTLIAETRQRGVLPAEVLPAPHLVGVPQGEGATAVWTRALENHLVDQMLARVVGEPSGGLIGATLRVQVKEYLALAQTHQADPALLAAALTEGRLPALVDLWAGSVPEDQRAIAEDAATVLVRFIEQEYGREGVLALLYATARAPSVDSLFAIAFGEDAASVEERWLDYVGQEITPEAALPILGA